MSTFIHQSRRSPRFLWEKQGMSRRILLSSLAGVVGLMTVGAFGIAALSSAEPGKSDPPAVAVAASRSTTQLPITGCALFSSGVGYFQREGEIDGTMRVDLTFPVQDINDLLKSMVLQDLGGGHIDAVSYESHDPIDKTLKSFAIDLTRNPTFGQILNQARGEKVEVVQQQAANQPGTLTGTVVGVEKQKQPAGKDAVIENEVLNMWCAEGLRTVKLTDVQRLRFLNPVMETEFRKALDVLSLSHDTQKKAVSLSFVGEGKRPVRVGYVVESPIWKTSYRLVLKEDGKPYLQGWAVVENPSDEDWKDVRMALISGRPISFQMDLYQPLYVPRPVVVPELFASLTPRTYEGCMDDNRKLAAKDAPPPTSAVAQSSSPGGDKAGGKAFERERLQELARRGAISWDEVKALDLRQGVNTAANASQLGDYFQYKIEHAVNLARQKSAMLPIVGRDIEGTKVSIFNQGTHPKFPLLGLKFKNTSGMNLMQGPITVFENNTYAGDSRILDLQPNEERLLSYAIDLGTEVEAINTANNGKVTKVKVNKGILYSTTLVHEAKNYKAKNRSQTDRLLIVEHPYRPEFHLVSSQKPSEQARDVYRFEVKIPAGKNGELDVAEERDVVSTVQLTNSDDQTIRQFLTLPVTSEKVKVALQKAIELRTTWAKTQQDLGQVQKQLKDITDDQGRLRANMRELPQSSPIYKKYLEKFEKQEGEIEEMQATIKKLQDTEHAQRQAFDNYLGSLDVE
jgi:hypothetical protein